MTTETPHDERLVRRWGEHRRPRRRRLRRRHRLALAVAALAALGVAFWLAVRPDPWRPPSGAPHFASCTYGGTISAWCGRLAVPEDAGRPGGRTISLRIAVVPATKRPAAGALFYLEGGPGGAATRSAVRVNELFAQVGRDRDLVMVDQRGTGGSHRLACPAANVRAADAEAVTAYLRSCFAGLRSDPRLYTSSAAADDLDRVRRALGYVKIDLFGGSYGATLAQVYLRRHPGSVRSVVLDGASLPDVRIYDLTARNAERALELQLARCAAAPACHRAFPRPRQELAELLARPVRSGAVVGRGTVRLRPDDVAWTIASLSATADGAASIPFAIHTAVQGDYAALADAYARTVGNGLDARARLAMFWVILCSEPWAEFDPAATARASAGSYLAEAAVARARLFQRACSVVPTARVPAAGGGVSELMRAPVLLLAGADDPLDPPANLRGWRDAFPNGRLVVVPGAGHGAIDDGCVPALVARFVARGSATHLDAGCVRRVALPPFQTG